MYIHIPEKPSIRPLRQDIFRLGPNVASRKADNFLFTVFTSTQGQECCEKYEYAYDCGLPFIHCSPPYSKKPAFCPSINKDAKKGKV